MTSLLIGSLLLLAATEDVPADTVVVCPRNFVKAFEPWLEFRAGQGHSFAYVHDLTSKHAVKAGIREAAKGGALKHIVIVGDAPGLNVPAGTVPLNCVPAHYEPSKVVVRWGSEPEIVTDNWYADLNDDGVPEVTVGRLPADNPWQLAAMVRKIMKYEESTDTGPWRRRINLVASNGNFGAIADTVIDTAARKLITDHVPADFETTLTQANWKSPYCPAPASFQTATLRRLNEGSLFFVYIGHGFPHRLHTVATPEGDFPILSSKDAAGLHNRIGPPIGVLLACYTTAFDAQEDCLSEELLKAEGGPVAVMGGSRVTMPYGMAVLSMSMLDECFVKRTPLLGEVLLNAKRRSVSNEPANPTRKLIDNIASFVSPDGKKLAEERAEHLHLINLLGDPLLRIKHSHPITLKVSEQANPGDVLEITGDSPLAGACTLELVCRRDRFTFTPAPRRRYENTPTAQLAFNEQYQQANDPRWLEATLDVPQGKFRTSVTIPATCRGPCHVRAFVEGDGECAMGAAPVYVRESHGTLADRAGK